MNLDAQAATFELLCAAEKKISLSISLTIYLSHGKSVSRRPVTHGARTHETVSTEYTGPVPVVSLQCMVWLRRGI